MMVASTAADRMAHARSAKRAKRNPSVLKNLENRDANGPAHVVRAAVELRKLRTSLLNTTPTAHIEAAEAAAEAALVATAVEEAAAVAKAAAAADAAERAVVVERLVASRAATAAAAAAAAPAAAAAKAAEVAADVARRRLGASAIHRVVGPMIEAHPNLEGFAPPGFECVAFRLKEQPISVQRSLQSGHG